MASLLELLGQTWPARMAQSAWSAAKLPGDVYAGRTDPLSEEGIGRSADLAGMVMGGTYAGAPAGAMGAGAIKPIRAYHGSPHDFDRFDLSKIGTGEGAQAYGHGLYFAENPAVAEEYKKALAGRNTAIMRTPLVKEAAADLGSSSKYLPDAILRELETGTPLDQMASRMSMDPLNRGRTPEEIQRAIDYVTTKFPEHKAIPGRMYEVNINAAPEQFLDWDKALNQQGPEVTAALQQAMRPRQWQDFSPAQAGTAMKQGFIGLDERIASEKLRDAGIPGIKYLDQGSRGNWAVRENPKGFYGVQSTSPGYGGAVSEYFPTRQGAQDWIKKQETSNYVLFRDDIIDIVKKYGLAGGAAILGMSENEAKAAMDDKPKTRIGRQSYGE